MTGWVAPAVRSLWRPAVRDRWATAVTAGTLALAIGVTTIIFAVVEAAVLRPFPFPEPARFVGVGAAFPSLNQPLEFFEALSAPEYVDIKRGARTLVDVTGFDLGNEPIAVDGQPERVFTAYGWDDPIAVLRVTPALGRGFTREELSAHAPVAIVSHAFWQAHYGGETRALGAGIKVGGRMHAIVGVLPARTRLYDTDLWIPMPDLPESLPRDRRQFNVVARLAPGASAADAAAELDVIAKRVAAEHGSAVPEYRGWALRAAPWADVDSYPLESTVTSALAAAVLVLLLASANLATIAIASSLARARDSAVRSALGATRARLLVEAVSERLVGIALGAAGGIAIAAWGIGALPALAGSSLLPADASLRIDGPVLALVAGLLLLVTLLVAVVPAAAAGRMDAAGILKAAGPGSTDAARHLRIRGAIVAGEVAVGLVVIAGAVLVARGSLALARVDPLFPTARLVTLRISLPPKQYDGERSRQFFESVIEQVRANGQVEHATAALQHAPFVFSSARFEIAGTAAAREGELPSAFVTVAASGYFETFGMRLQSGRWLDDRAEMQAPLEAVVNVAAARRYFNGAVSGRRIRIRGQGWDDRWMDVVGVVADVRNRGLAAPTAPEIFVSLRQAPARRRTQLYVAVRTVGEPAAGVSAVRQIVRQLDPDLPVYAVATVDRLLASGLAARRLAALALGAFGALALLLSGLGVYGVLSHGVQRRRREIGLRLALGASSRDVARVVMVRHALVPVSSGMLLGAAFAWAGSRAMAALLFGLRLDASTIVMSAAALAAVALLAALVPLRRALTLSPSELTRLAADP